MGSLINFFNIVLYQPLLNALILLYEYLPGHDLGVAVIILTLIIRLILHPSSIKAVRSQKALSSLQPKIAEIQKKYKDSREKQAKATMELYKKEKISPFSGCLPLLLQLPILIALYQVFLNGLKPEVLKTMLYTGVPFPQHLSPTFLGILDLSKPSIWLALITGAVQFIYSKMTAPASSKKSPRGDFSQIMQSQMLYFFPLMTVFIVWKLGAIIGLYWVCSTLFSIGEQYLVKGRQKNERKKI